MKNIPVYSARFLRLAQLLFTNEIPKKDSKAAAEAIDAFKKAEIDLQSWLDNIEKNLNVFDNYHGPEKALVIISEKFDDITKKQKEKYERVINSIKKAIDMVMDIQDVEMQDMITNLTKLSEDFSEIFNELNDSALKIGEAGFIEQFKNGSQKIIDNSESFFDVLTRVKDYMEKNILGQQSLS